MKSLIALLALAMLNGCQTTPTPTTGAKFIPCSVAPIIKYSGPEDSRETINQVKDFNAVRKASCEG